jgi:hypothetical protein
MHDKSLASSEMKPLKLIQVHQLAGNASLKNFEHVCTLGLPSLAWQSVMCMGWFSVKAATQPTNNKSRSRNQLLATWRVPSTPAPTAHAVKLQSRVVARAIEAGQKYTHPFMFTN